MSKGINWRFVTIIALTLVSLYLIFPTARYFQKVATENIPPDIFATLRDNYSEYFSNKPPQDPIEKKQFDKNLDDALKAFISGDKLEPELKKLSVQQEKVGDFKKILADLKKQKEFDYLRDKSLKLGLDLLGGVDILLAIDMKKTQEARLNEIVYNLKRRFANENIDALFDVAKQTASIKVKIQNKKDLRNAKNLLGEQYYKETFKPFNPDDLESDNLELTLRPEVTERYAQEAISGALKVIRSRVDELKVTQPSVAKQGKNRIRVQLPGERDPERVIANIIKPATLEFRIVHDESEEKVNQIYNLDGTLKPGAEPLPGYVFRKGVITRRDETSRPIEEKIGYLLKDKIEMTGEYLRNSWVVVNNADLDSPVQVYLEFDRTGAKQFRDVTSRNKDKRLAILLDNIVYSAPVIQETIPQGRCFIRGNFMVPEAQDLSLVLKAGALPADLEPVEKRAIGASLGADSIRDSVKALIIGATVVILFMIAYYGTAGIIADIALLLNVLLILAVLALAKATLTLSGIGGILLTIGMAVDANVLIYERIREEVESKKPIKAAVSVGFRRAFTVIFDSNLTTLIAALILLQFAEGSVQGFALTMTIGLIANLYTGLTVTHTIADMIVSYTGKLSLGKIRIFHNTKFNILKLRKFTFISSVILILVGFGALINRKGTLWAIDFSGGVISEVGFNQKVPLEKLRQSFTQSGISNAVIQNVPNKNEYLIKTKLLENDIQKTQEVIQNILSSNFPNEKFEIMGTNAIGSEVGQEFIATAIKTVLLSCICMLIYISFRFQFIFGVGATIATIHDVLVVLGLIALSGREISLDVISAILIVIGYSVNDTIVIFDRIRENLGSASGEKFYDLANRSINECLNRTTNTSLTTLFTVTVLYLFSKGSLNDFAFVLIFGIIVGTYSSDFIATPIVYEWNRYQGVKIEKDKQYRKTGYSAVAQKR